MEFIFLLPNRSNFIFFKYRELKQIQFIIKQMFIIKIYSAMIILLNIKSSLLKSCSNDIFFNLLIFLNFNYIKINFCSNY